MKIPEEALKMAVKRMKTMDYELSMEMMALQTATVLLNDYLNENPKMKDLIFTKIREMEVNDVTN